MAARIVFPTFGLVASRPKFGEFQAKNRRLQVRSSSEASPETVVESPSEDASSSASSSVVGKSQGFSSLITADNVQKALRGIAITTVDHYGRLDIPRGASYDQVNVAYKRKCEDLMYRGLDEEQAEQELALLKESYAILSSEEERRLYDWSIARSEKPDRYVWPFEVDITQTPTEPPPPQEPEDVGPTRLVGYFLVGWFVLSIVLSIELNR
ncbi:NAD(P)H-quinone oxidoreductase subunit U, chloroplastic [Nymphaea colorata]|nr:NAD(P)H-quinone oxidoreductase subunit U, chloroplastic [Nymphaea colorata]